MLKFISDQSDKLISGLVGATIGTVIIFSRMNIWDAFYFLISFYGLFCLQGIPRYFALQKNMMGKAFLLYLIFLLLWLITLIIFANFRPLSDGWKKCDIQLETFVVLIAFALGNFISIVLTLVSTYTLTQGDEDE